jgi:hypothetical protein
MRNMTAVFMIIIFSLDYCQVGNKSSELYSILTLMLIILTLGHLKWMEQIQESTLYLQHKLMQWLLLLVCDEIHVQLQYYCLLVCEQIS